MTYIYGKQPSLPRTINGERSDGRFQNVAVDDNGNIITASGESPPTDPSKNNPSKIFGYTDGKLTSITQTIDGIDYQKTFGYTGDDLTSSSEWIEL